MKVRNLKTTKRNRIADSALRLFASSDYFNVSMDEIAKAAGVAKGTLYNYFSSKEDLYVNIMKQRFEKLIFILDRAFSGRREPWRDLRSFIIHYETFMYKHPHFFRLRQRMRTEPGFENIFESLERRIIDLLTSVIKKGMKLREFKNGSGEFCARLVLGMVERECEHRICKKEGRQKADEIIRFLKTGLAGEDNVGTKRGAAR